MQVNSVRRFENLAAFEQTPALLPLPQRLHQLRRPYRTRRAVVELLFGGDRQQLRHGGADSVGGAERRRARRSRALSGRRRHGGVVPAVRRGDQAAPDAERRRHQLRRAQRRRAAGAAQLQQRVRCARRRQRRRVFPPSPAGTSTSATAGSTPTAPFSGWRPVAFRPKRRSHRRPGTTSSIPRARILCRSAVASPPTGPPVSRTALTWRPAFSRRKATSSTRGRRRSAVQRWMASSAVSTWWRCASACPLASRVRRPTADGAPGPGSLHLHGAGAGHRRARSGRRGSPGVWRCITTPICWRPSPSPSAPTEYLRRRRRISTATGARRSWWRRRPGWCTRFAPTAARSQAGR